MLGLYLYTLIIGHKSSKMLSLLNKLALPKKLQVPPQQTFIQITLRITSLTQMTLS